MEIITKLIINLDPYQVLVHLQFGSSVKPVILRESFFLSIEIYMLTLLKNEVLPLKSFLHSPLHCKLELPCSSNFSFGF